MNDQNCKQKTKKKMDLFSVRLLFSVLDRKMHCEQSVIQLTMGI